MEILKNPHCYRLLVSLLFACSLVAEQASESSSAEVAEAVALAAATTPEQNVYYTDAVLGEAVFEIVPHGAALVGDGNRLYAIGGIDEDGALLASIEILEWQGSQVVRKEAQLSQPLAFASAVAHGGALYVVGGMTEAGVSARVFALRWENEVIVESELPVLPAPRMLTGVAIHRTTVKDHLYVLGGIESLDAEVASAQMYELYLGDAGKPSAHWERKEDIPGGGRIAAIVRTTYNEIVMAGGWTVGPEGVLKLAAEVWGYARVARDGDAVRGWEGRGEIPVLLADAAFAKTGQSHLTVFGGDTSEGQLADYLQGTKATQPTPAVWTFHDPTETWNQIGELERALSGGLLHGMSNDRYVLVGARDRAGATVATRQIDFARTTQKMRVVDGVVIAVYFIFVAAVGAWFARRQNSAEEFALGNRNTKWWAAGISMFATGVSTISFMALPALYACAGLANVAQIFWMVPGIFIGAYVTFPLLRRLNLTSTYEYLEQRYGSALRLVGSFISIVGQIMGRIGIVVMLPSLAIASMTGMDPAHAIILLGAVTILYSSAGGFDAVIWTDVAQGMLMIVGFAIIGILAFANVPGGVDGVITEARALDRFRFIIPQFDLSVNMIWFGFFASIISIMSFASDQNTAQRVLCTPMKDVRKLSYLGGAFSIGIALLVAVVGIGLFGFFRTHPELMNPVMKNDQLVPLFILHRVPVGLSGLLIATLFAAAMSTVSSSVNSSSVLFAEDFYKRFKKNVSSREEMRVMQIFTVFSGVVGIGVALWLLNMPMPTLWESFLRITALFGGGFVGVYSLGMFTRRTHELGAILGVVVSCFVAYYIQRVTWDVHYGGLVIFIVGSCMLSGYVFSWIIPWKRKPLHGLTVWDQMTNEEAEARLKATVKNER